MKSEYLKPIQKIFRFSLLRLVILIFQGVYRGFLLPLAVAIINESTNVNRDEAYSLP